ncbi:MAG TPA: tetratricopeptide repeat protein [Candidatus Udaeobacter sp.]|nr:tetratricopeptide repeat protein [Candidatus Udaeobacter sp.]
MKSGTLFAELKRRNVYKVAVAYVVVAWLLIQAASILFPTFDAPPWAMKVLVAVLVLCFPVALVLSWAFEITPEGIKLESEIAAKKSITRKTGRKIVGLTIAVAIVAAGLLVFQMAGRDRWAHRSAEGNPEGGRPGSPPLPIPAKSIAVLPFDNLSRDPDNAYFCEGVQDEILTRLAKVADLKVISRTSTQHFKSAPDNIPEIAKKLGVMHILEGSVQKASGQVRVNVQLINAMTDAHLWADTFDRNLTDIFAVETEIAKAIAEVLQAKLTGSEKTSMSNKPTENPEAYELYLKGRFFWNKRTATDLWKSIEFFNQAIEKDPGYALAYAGEAQAWSLLSAYNGASPADSYPQAEAFARKALALDANCAEALVGSGSFKARYQFDVRGALKDYERAIQLNPNDSTAHHWLGGDCFAATGQHAREVAELKRALELDPLSLIINSNLGVAYNRAGRFEEAVAQFRKAVQMDDRFYPAHREYALALELQGKIPEAISEYEKAAALTDDPIPLGALGRIYGITGRKDEAQKILAQLQGLRAQRYTAAYSLALVALGLGDKTEALHWLEESYRERDGDSIGVIRVDPLLRSLRGDPRFEALAEKIVPARLFESTTAFK